MGEHPHRGMVEWEGIWEDEKEKLGREITFEMSINKITFY